MIDPSTQRRFKDPASRAAIAKEIVGYLESAGVEATEGERLSKDKTGGLWDALQKAIDGAYTLAIEIEEIEFRDSQN